jgi:hypothetical protein
MDATSFYRAVDAQLCQGDLLERVPHVFLKEQPHLLRKATLPKKKKGYEIEELPEGSLPTTPVDGGLVPATCHVTRAMLLTHGCEIDKDKKHRLVALIRPMSKDWNEENRTVVKEGRDFSLFYLPPGEGQLAESYVDFRRICTVAPRWVDSTNRLASLSEEARKAMLFQLFRFLLARDEVNPEVFGAKQ